ncbi:hypothetical protein BDV28DRAFT_143669, partial [Aspergillus coremiiformis]
MNPCSYLKLVGAMQPSIRLQEPLESMPFGRSLYCVIGWGSTDSIWASVDAGRRVLGRQRFCCHAAHCVKC